MSLQHVNYAETNLKLIMEGSVAQHKLFRMH